MQDFLTLYFGWHQIGVLIFSLIISIAIIVFQGHLSFNGRRDDTAGAVQQTHTRKTPRIGGLAIYGAICLSIFLAPEVVSTRYAIFFLPVTFLFVVGLFEDVGFYVSPRNRLLAVAFSSALAIILLGVWIPRIGIPLIDGALSYWFVGASFTIFITAGITHGFNLIDGVHGLSSSTAVFAAIAMAVVSHQAGYVEMVDLALMLASAIIGFFLLNFPFGRIFLGDAGAYTLGFVLSWFGISILLSVPEASPWAILLMFFWPVADTLLAIYRRIRQKKALSAPDKLHVHQMVLRALEICVLGRNRRHVANPLTTLVLAPFIAAPPIVGVVLWSQNMNSFLAVLLFGLLFFTSYALAPIIIKRFRLASENREADSVHLVRERRGAKI